MSINKCVKSHRCVHFHGELLTIIVFIPRHAAIANTQPLHIAFNAHGLGHYDAAFWASPEPQKLCKELSPST